MAFTSWSLSDEELEDLDPWLKKNLGKAGEGSEWTIERQKDGSVQAMLIGKDGTARSRKTLPSTVAPKEPEKFKDPWAKQEEAPAAAPVEEAEEVVKPTAPVKGRRDFRRPASRQSTQSAPISSARFEPRANPTAGPRYTPPKPTTRREGPSYTPPEPKARPVEEDLPPVIDPAEKRKKSRTTYEEGDTATRGKLAYTRKRGEPSDYEFTQTPVRREGGKWVDDPKDADTTEKSTKESFAVTGTPKGYFTPKKEGKSFFGKVGGAVAGAAKGVAGMFGGEDEDAPPAWINDPGVGVSSPGLLHSTARSEAVRNAKGEGGMGGGQFWTNPKDGTTYFRRKTEEADLPAEIDMTDVPPARSLEDYEGETEWVDPSGPKPDWVDSPPSGMYVGKGKRRDLQVGVDKAMSNARSQYAEVVGEAQGRTSRRSMWIDPETNETYVLLATPDTEKKKTDSKVKIESERFEGTPPEELETEKEQLEVDLDDPVIIDRLTNPLTPAPVDNPEPIELPFKTKTDERSDTKKVKDSPVASDMVIKTQEALGTDWKSPTGQIVITSAALEEEASTEPEPPYRLTIDPNVNIATVLDSQGMEVRQFAVGTGDTTGTRYGKKYFTPTGTAEVINKVPYEQVEGSYGPIWMGLDWKSYGLHGPHAAADIKATGTGFENQGFVSHGCIRFMEKDLMDLSEYLNVGSSVEVLPYKTRPLHRGPLRVGAK